MVVRGIRIINIQKGGEQAERRIVADVVGHWRNGSRQFLQRLYGTQRNARRRRFTHRVDQHAAIVKGDQAVGLVAVGQKRPGHRFADDQANYRVAGQTGFGISASRPGQRLVNAESFFAAAIGLAWHIDHGDDRPFDWLVGVGGNGFINHFRQRPAFQQADFAAGGARVVVVSIRDHGDKTHVFAINLAVCHLDGRAQAAHQRRVGRQFVQPQRGAVWELTHYLSSRAKSCLICAVSACWRVSNWLKRRR